MRTPHRLFLIACLCLAAATSIAEEPKHEVLFHSGMNGVPNYRIPALETTTNGVVVAICDARGDRGQDLPNDIDLVMRRSTDAGETWSDPKIIVDSGAQGSGDAALLSDSETGRLWCFYVYAPDGVSVWTSQPGADGDTLRLRLIHSDDDGATWSEPRDITAEVKPPAWDAVWSSPGRGHQDADGRLYFPLSRRSGDVSYSHFIYSDDHGESWTMGGPAFENSNEWTLVTLSNGHVMGNIRSDHGKKLRGIAYSPDRGATWTGFHHDEELTGPTCQACLMGYRNDAASYLLFSNPTSTERKRLAVKLSRDEGDSWPIEKVLHEGPAAYSCMTVLPDGQIGILYERGEESPYETVTFAKFPVDWLTE